MCELIVGGDSRGDWKTAAHFEPGSPLCSNGQNGDCQSNSCIDPRCSVFPLDNQLFASPDAEAGMAAPAQDSIVPVPGWVTQGPFIAIDSGNRLRFWT